MAFENKDLLTKLLPQIAEYMTRRCWLVSGICQWPTFHCHVASNCRATVTFCDDASMTCMHLSRICGASMTTVAGCLPVSTPFVIEYQEDLIAIRKELVDTLQRLEKLQQDGLASTITTRREADKLEENLEQQLERLRRVRDGLK